jgi:hypothetical protein
MGVDTDRKTDSLNGNAAPRRLSCARCGASFECGLGGDCWCAAEPYRLPMSDSSEDCLCPACLRDAAKSAGI